MNDWNVYVGDRKVAVVELTDAQVGPFFERLEDPRAEMRLTAWMNGGVLTGD